MKIAVLLSGGVDSALALKLLVAKGHQCTAFYLKIWLEDELSFLGDCPWETDLGYVRATCQALGVPLIIIPLQREYHERVVRYTLDELRAGRTPSPDIFCNERVKFGAFFDHIDESFERVATGHYARLLREDGRTSLALAPDPVKDQTYFLAHLSAAQLARALFPVGELVKAEVRRLAHEYALPPAERKDSQGICFLGKVKFRDFAKSYLGEQPGEIIEQGTGRVLGQHAGYWFHTIGQRTGLGLSGGPWFVVRKDIVNNRIEVVHGQHYQQALLDHFPVEEMHWINDAPAAGDGLRCKLRHGPHIFACSLSYDPNDSRKGMVRLLDGEDAGCAPGQFAVFYRDEICLGMARIAAG